MASRSHAHAHRSVPISLPLSGNHSRHWDECHVGMVLSCSIPPPPRSEQCFPRRPLLQGRQGTTARFRSIEVKGIGLHLLPSSIATCQAATSPPVRQSASLPHAPTSASTTRTQHLLGPPADHVDHFPQCILIILSCVQCVLCPVSCCPVLLLSCCPVLVP